MLRASEETREKENDLTNYQKLSEIIRNYKGDIGEVWDDIYPGHFFYLMNTCWNNLRCDVTR